MIVSKPAFLTCAMPSSREQAVYGGSGLDRVDQPVFLAAADLRVEPLGSVVVVSGLPGHLGEPSSATLLPARSKQRPRSAGAAMRLDDVQVVHDADPLPGERAPGEVDR